MSKRVSSDNNYKHCMGRSINQNTHHAQQIVTVPRCVLLSRTDNSNCIMSSLSPWSDGCYSTRLLQHDLNGQNPLEYGVIGESPRHS